MPKGVYTRTDIARVNMSQARKKYFETHSSYNKGLRFYGDKNNNWRGEEVTYTTIHNWLKRNFGNPIECEFCGKIGYKRNTRWNIQWALIHGEEYLHKRENFIGLCVSCHVKYDKRPLMSLEDGIRLNFQYNG